MTRPPSRCTPRSPRAPCLTVVFGHTVVGRRRRRNLRRPVGAENVFRSLWVPKISSGPVQLDFLRRETGGETALCRCPSSTWRSSECSNCSGSSGVTTKNWRLNWHAPSRGGGTPPPGGPPSACDRALLAGLSRHLGRRRLGRFFIQPETLLRWHRDL